MVYNRWQIAGRKETPAPYWIIGAPDGRGQSYYTMGSRTPFGLNNYFRSLVECYQAVRQVIHPDARVVQLVSFSDSDRQLPLFLEAMERAGYREDASLILDQSRIWRSVPHRRWYNYLDPEPSPARELLLIHHLAR